VLYHRRRRENEEGKNRIGMKDCDVELIIQKKKENRNKN
jgi:hypothetical protein